MPKNDRLSRIEKLVAENSIQIRELRKYQKETTKQIRELRESQKRTDKLAGELMNRWGQLPEDMLANSVRTQFGKILKNIAFLGPRVSKSMNGKNYETDFIVEGKLEGEDVVVVVELKTTPRKKDFEQLEDNIRKLPEFFGHYKSKKRIGCIGWVRYKEDFEKEAWKRGYYTMVISGETAIISNPVNFKPKMV